MLNIQDVQLEQTCVYQIAHTATVTTLPFHHRDPFDRLLVAQALTEQIPIVSIDAILDTYAVDRRW